MKSLVAAALIAGAAVSLPPTGNAAGQDDQSWRRSPGRASPPTTAYPPSSNTAAPCARRSTAGCRRARS
jgi:hypothetical protein